VSEARLGKVGSEHPGFGRAVASTLDEAPTGANGEFAATIFEDREVGIRLRASRRSLDWSPALDGNPQWYRPSGDWPGEVLDIQIPGIVFTLTNTPPDLGPWIPSVELITSNGSRLAGGFPLLPGMTQRAPLIPLDSYLIHLLNSYCDDPWSETWYPGVAERENAEAVTISAATPVQEVDLPTLRNGVGFAGVVRREGDFGFVTVRLVDGPDGTSLCGEIVAETGDGHFEFAQVPPGEYRIEVTVDGTTTWWYPGVGTRSEAEWVSIPLPEGEILEFDVPE
jgi:hypothetical protein